MVENPEDQFSQNEAHPKVGFVGQVFLEGILSPQNSSKNQQASNCIFLYAKIFEPYHGKTNILVSDLVRHKPGCTSTEDG